MIFSETVVVTARSNILEERQQKTFYFLVQFYYSNIWSVNIKVDEEKRVWKVCVMLWQMIKENVMPTTHDEGYGQKEEVTFDPHLLLYKKTCDS